MKKQKIYNIIYPVQTKKGIRYAPRNDAIKSHVQQANTAQLLDGFELLYSCKCKLPDEAIKSKLNSRNFTDVNEEDLAYFLNLSVIDLSDNKLRLE